MNTNGSDLALGPQDPAGGSQPSNFGRPGGAGGGAIDPVTACIAVGLAAAGLAARRRGRN